MLTYTKYCQRGYILSTINPLDFNKQNTKKYITKSLSQMLDWKIDLYNNKKIYTCEYKDKKLTITTEEVNQLTLTNVKNKLYIIDNILLKLIQRYENQTNCNEYKISIEAKESKADSEIKVNG